MPDISLSLDFTPGAAAFIEAGATGRMPDGRQVDEVAVVGPRGEGKFVPYDTLILTPSGWVKAVDISVGDQVISVDGSATEIVGVFPQPPQDLWQLHFSDKTSLVSSEDHLWAVETAWDRNGGAQADARDRRGIGPRRHSDHFARRHRNRKVVTTREIVSALQAGRWKRGGRWSIPTVAPVQLDAHPVPIDPYLIGLLLGDGTLATHGIQFTTTDPEILDAAAKALPSGVYVRPMGTRDQQYSFSAAPGLPNRLMRAISALGLLGHRSWEKFIPQCYLWNTANVRLAVLQGLMDTDGTVLRHSNSVSFSTTSPKLADDVVFVVQSLGGTVTRTSRYTKYPYKGEIKTGRLSYHLTVRLPNSTAPFRLTRKLEIVRAKSKRNVPRRHIVSADPAGNGPGVCFRVAHHSGLFVVQDFIVTHNSWAALGCTLRHAQLHEQAGFPLPVPWFWFRDSFPNHARNLLEDLQRPEWSGLWKQSDGGRLVVAEMHGQPIVKAFLFGLEDTDAVERLRGGCVGIYGEEPAPAVGAGVGVGWNEASWSLALSSQGRNDQTHYRPAIIASNYPDKSHWFWRRFADPGEPQCGLIRLKSGDRSTEAYRQRLGRTLASQPAMYKRLFLGEPAPPQLGDPVVCGYREAVHYTRRALPIAPGPLRIGWDFWHCYDDKTDVLTSDGWKPFSALIGTEQFATRRISDGTMEYQHATSVIRKPHHGAMIQYQAQNVDFCLTPDHLLSVFVHDRGRYTHKRREAKKLLDFTGNTHYEVALTARWNSKAKPSYGPYGWTPTTFARFIGWYVSEGFSYNGTVVICQNTDREDLSRLLRSTNLPWTPVVRRGCFAGWKIHRKALADYLLRSAGHGAHKKRIPKEILNMPAVYIQEFLESYVAGDGHSRVGNFGTWTTAYTVSEGLADDLQESALKAGMSSRKSWVPPCDSVIDDGDGANHVAHGGGGWRVSLKRRALRATLHRQHVSEVQYDGTVYCVSVPNQTLYVRRNGVPHWNGNCPAAVVSSMASSGQLRIHFAQRMDRADIGMLIEEAVRPWLVRNGLQDRHRIHTGDPTGATGDQSDRSQSAVKRMQKLLPGEWTPSTNEIHTLQYAVNEALRRNLSTGEPCLQLGPDASELDSAWAGGWHLNEHGAPVQHGERGQYSHVGMAGAYLVHAVFGRQGEQINVGTWANQSAYTEPWDGSQERQPSPAVLAIQGRPGGTFNAAAWQKQYSEE